MTGVLPPTHLKVARGAPIEIELEFADSLGSPAPTLAFTLATARNTSTKIHTADVEVVDGEPTKYRVFLGPSVTNREPAKYWWDVWYLDIDSADNDQPVAMGSLEVQGVVRLP